MMHTFNVSLLYFLFDLQLNWLLTTILFTLWFVPSFCFYKAFEPFFTDH
ncbi:hypothetical protein ACIAD1851 [Acinetobacter baylyi ADP1]|uniref:Uncharacterized protein n=1 Tax=Acinetobacter baylyi (strain ATCC 33305 / BD413 / ADP1) TaxID=62977 RepID=Q6FB79_ACIAD|nr:hypothetical protein ACIAD1851 [Acinetobacter baylyi ADP1]